MNDTMRDDNGWIDGPREITKDELPRISFVIATYNSANFVEETIRSILKQDYPHDKIEIVFSDGGSTDSTLEIAKKYSIIRVVKNELMLGDPGYAIGCEKAKGDLVVFVGHDNRLVQKNWIRMMIKPFMEADVVGAFPHLDNRKEDSWLTKYVNRFTDPFNHFLYGYANNPLTFHKIFKVLQKGEGWVVYDFNLKNHPLLAYDQGFMLKKKGYIRDRKTWYCDILPVLDLIAAGKQIAYVPAASNYHETLNLGLKQFIKKHQWGIDHNLSSDKVYGSSEEEYGLKARRKHISLKRQIRAFMYPCYGITFILPCIRALYKYLKDGEKEWLYHPQIVFVSSYIIWKQAIKILVLRQKPVFNRY